MKKTRRKTKAEPSNIYDSPTDTYFGGPTDPRPDTLFAEVLRMQNKINEIRRNLKDVLSALGNS